MAKMKIQFFPLLFVIVSSCNFNPFSSLKSEAPTVFDEKYDPTEAELFAECADLRGVGQFVIGKTTFKQVLADKDYRKEYSSTYHRRSNVFNGHWGSDFWKSKEVEYELPSSSKSKWMEAKTSPVLKQLPSTPYTGLTVGGLKFDTFDMAFLNDTLVAIYFYPGADIEDDVISHYKEKYGNGRGKMYSYRLFKPNKKTKPITTEIFDEIHLWENPSVALSYEKHEYFKMNESGVVDSSYKCSMMIYSKKRYPVFEAMLLKIADEYDDQKRTQKEQSLDSL